MLVGSAMSVVNFAPNSRKKFMYTCPHCKKNSITLLDHLSSFGRRLISCSVCSAKIRIKKQPSNYLFSIFLFSSIVLNRFKNNVIDEHILLFLALAIFLLMLQVKLIEYEEVFDAKPLNS